MSPAVFPGHRSENAILSKILNAVISLEITALFYSRRGLRFAGFWDRMMGEMIPERSLHGKERHY